jgi:hypothetical protein
MEHGDNAKIATRNADNELYKTMTCIRALIAHSV